MRFPAWVEAERGAKRASARLKYILNQLAIDHTERGSMRALGELVGLDHSTLSGYVRRGSFTETAALKVEQAVGRKAICHEHLTTPLKITKA